MAVSSSGVCKFSTDDSEKFIPAAPVCIDAKPHRATARPHAPGHSSRLIHAEMLHSWPPSRGTDATYGGSHIASLGIATRASLTHTLPLDAITMNRNVCELAAGGIRFGCQEEWPKVQRLPGPCGISARTPLSTDSTPSKNNASGTTCIDRTLR